MRAFRTFRTLGVGLGSLLLAQLFLRATAPPRLELEVYPRVCSVPCTLRVRVRVDPREDNRQITVEVSGPDYNSVSSVLVDGVEAPHTLPFFWYRDLPAGDYEVAVTLLTTSGSTVTRAQTFEVR